MDWGADGIRNSYRYELVHHTDTSITLGEIGCVTGGQVDYGYRTDCRAAATLSFDGAWPSTTAMVRIWHDAALGGETYTECLGTFVQAPGSSTFDKGSQTGSVSLYSPIYKLNKDRKPVTSSIKAGTDARAMLRSAAEGCGCVCAPMPNVSGTLRKSHVWVGGETVYTECDRLADAMGARLGVDEWGRITCEPYTAPSGRALSGYLPSGAESVIVPGLEAKRREIVNKVIARHQEGETEWVCKAVVPDSHPWSYGNLGYWAAADYSVTDVESKAALQRYADDMLASVSFPGLTYSVKALYMPEVQCGGIWALTHDGVEVSGMVVTKSVTLDQKMLMELTIEEVR